MRPPTKEEKSWMVAVGCLMVVPRILKYLIPLASSNLGEQVILGMLLTIDWMIGISSFLLFFLRKQKWWLRLFAIVPILPIYFAWEITKFSYQSGIKWNYITFSHNSLGAAIFLVVLGFGLLGLSGYLFFVPPPSEQSTSNSAP